MNKPIENNKSIIVVGVRFSKIGKSYFFNTGNLIDIYIGDTVVVQTSRGWQIGEIAEIIDKPDKSESKNYKKITRRATPADILKQQEIRKREDDITNKVRQKIRALDIHGMKLISSEMNFDEKGITFLYSSEDEEIKGFNKLQNEVKKEYQNMDISFHKIGPRDVARYYGGMGACGLETRCCTKFLCDFESISIRMAKTQGVSLSPGDITGMCDRLRCCLNYEYCQYEQALKGMPKRNKKVITPKGEGVVRDLLPLRKMVLVDLPEIGVREFDVEEIQLILDQKSKPQINHDNNRFEKKKK